MTFPGVGRAARRPFANQRRSGRSVRRCTAPLQAVWASW